jgi:hypothetical protein
MIMGINITTEQQKKNGTVSFYFPAVRRILTMYSTQNKFHFRTQPVYRVHANGRPYTTGYPSRMKTKFSHEQVVEAALYFNKAIARYDEGRGRFAR